MIYRLIQPPKKRLKLNKTTKPNFFRSNFPIVISSLLYQFMNMRIEKQEDDENSIINPLKIIEYDPKTDLDFYTFYSRIISTPTNIYTIFFKADEKYSKQFVCYALLEMYNLTTEMFARSRLRIINTTGMYYFVFKSPHNFDVELALNESLEKFGVTKPENLEKYIRECEDVHTNKSK